jgi:hypothetical protein
MYLTPHKTTVSVAAVAKDMTLRATVTGIRCRASAALTNLA